MTGLFQTLLADTGLPPVPTSFNVAHFDSNSNAVTAARQATIEPSSGGTDRARSYSLWVKNFSFNTGLNRILGVGSTSSSSNQQFNLSVYRATDTDPDWNQKLLFSIFGNSANTIFINCRSTNRILKNRWYHIVITYDGSETANGIKMYINGVEDTTVTRNTAGSYTGAYDNAAHRWMLSRVDVASPPGYFTGDMRDLGVWNRVLTSGEVTSLYGSTGSPVSVIGQSFYATAILAYYSLQSSIACFNNAALDFSSSTGVTFRSIPVSSSYASFTIFNLLPASTTYKAFGSIRRDPFDPTKFVWDGRQGTSHIASGNAVKVTMNSTSLTGSLVVTKDETNDLGGVAAVQVGSLIKLFSCTRNIPTFLDLVRYDSTDGLVGETFGSLVSVPFTLPVYNFYGKVVEGYDNDHYVNWYEFDTAGAGTYRVNLLHIDSGGTLTNINVWQGTGATPYTESQLILIGSGRAMILSRSEDGDLHIFKSSDGALQVWTGPTATGLSTGTCMGDWCIDPLGRINLIYADRADNVLYVSPNNPVETIWNDPTDWEDRTPAVAGYTTDSTGVLGYPVIMQDGFNIAAFFSMEFSNSRADLYGIYGYFGFGV